MSDMTSSSKRASSPFTGSLARWDSDHSTVVQAPVQFMWESLVDIPSWQWNPCVRLNAESVLAGACGKASLAVCSGRWKTWGFTFETVDHDTFTFSWGITVGTCRITNKIKLSPDGAKITKVDHRQTFRGAFPGLRWKLPIEKMKNYPMLMNEALKNHVESQHFNQLLDTLSTREMSAATDFTASMDLSESPGSRTNYWESSPQVRKQLLSTFLDERLKLSP